MPLLHCRVIEQHTRAVPQESVLLKGFMNILLAIIIFTSHFLDSELPLDPLLLQSIEMPNDLLFMSKTISCLPLHSQQTALAQHPYHLLVYEFIGIRHGCKLFTINMIIIQNCVGVLFLLFLIRGYKKIIQVF